MNVPRRCHGAAFGVFGVEGALCWSGTGELPDKRCHPVRRPAEPIGREDRGLVFRPVRQSLTPLQRKMFARKNFIRQKPLYYNIHRKRRTFCSIFVVGIKGNHIQRKEEKGVL